MSAKIGIPHPVEVLYGGGVSLACGLQAEIAADKLHGFFAGDTRVLSTYTVALQGARWRLLGRERHAASAVTWFFQNPRVRGPFGQIAEGALLLRLRRQVSGALRDELVVRSYVAEPLRARLTMHVDSDFADIFEVKEQSIPPRLNLLRTARGRTLCFEYRTDGFRRALEVRFQRSLIEPSFLGTLVVFDLHLEPEEEWACAVEALPTIDDVQLQFSGDAAGEDAARTGSSGVSIGCGDPLRAAFVRGQCDLHELAVPQPEAPPYAAAGVPWFFTLFGRDTLMTALMAGLHGAWLGEGALVALAAHQANTRDDWRDAEPGKLPHEIRNGELARRDLIPHRAYYGTHDTQALYCLALWHLWRWTGNRSLLETHWDAACAALRWCEQYGDRDGDGFQEYATRSRQGYYNQGWKDAGDAIVDAEGAIAELPLATIELQGYLFAAYAAMAELAEARGVTGEPDTLREKAETLRRAVEDRFWMDEEGCYALALDGRKRLVRSVASNCGHLLWCGLPSEARAHLLADRFLQPDMFSGWGLRTLSSHNPAYNPLAYQRGSVWPFDTVLTAQGMARYGSFEPAAALVKGVLDAGAAFEQERLPELFCGMERGLGPPLPYAKANIPQAWSAAAPILAAQLFLGLLPDAPHGRCFLAPRLPVWLPELSLRGIVVGRGRLDVTIARRGEATRLEEVRAEGVKVVQGSARAPLWGRP